jgi:16S rRNA processing protein RimM
MSKPKKPNDPVAMAVVGAAHGIKGEVRVKAFTGDPAAIGDYGPLYAEDGRVLTVDTARRAGEVVVVKFREVVDRAAAEALGGMTLSVDRTALPADLDEDEFYHADLVGLLVVDEDGDKLGKVVALHDFGAGDVIEIALASGRRAMIPFTRAAVPEIDLGESMIRIDSVAAGLDEAESSEEAAHRKHGQDFDPANRPRGPKAAGGNR